MVNEAARHLDSEYAVLVIAAKTKTGCIPQPAYGTPRAHSLGVALLEADNEEVSLRTEIDHNV